MDNLKMGIGIGILTLALLYISGLVDIAIMGFFIVVYIAAIGTWAAMRYKKYGQPFIEFPYELTVLLESGSHVVGKYVDHVANVKKKDGTSISIVKSTGEKCNPNSFKQFIGEYQLIAYKTGWANYHPATIDPGTGIIQPEAESLMTMFHAQQLKDLVMMYPDEKTWWNQYGTIIITFATFLGGGIFVFIVLQGLGSTISSAGQHFEAASTTLAEACSRSLSQPPPV